MGEEAAAIYCLVPEALAHLADRLRAHYADDPRVEVIIDRRTNERRSPRRDGSVGNRRRGVDRRRHVLPRRLAPLPLDLAREAKGIRWVQRLRPVSASMESLHVAEVVERLQAGDPDAATELYWRYYERVHSRLCVLLGDPAAADRAVGPAFGRVIDAAERAGDADVYFEDMLYAEVEALAAGKPADDAEISFSASLRVDDPDLDEPLKIKEPDRRWPDLARTERDRLLRALPAGSVEAVEHIGSTAVGIAGRPVVDLLIGVASLPVPYAVRRGLARAGYEACGGAGSVEREYFRKRTGTHFDLHVVEHESRLWREPLAVREFLRRNPTEAQRYAKSKREAARSARGSSARYADLRDDVLQHLAARAAATAAR